MSATQSKPSGPDLAGGISVDDISDGSMLAGHVDEKSVFLARRGDEFFAIDAKCTHYGGPLAEGLMVEDTVRCPWHHACFSLRTGEALRAPALTPVTCWAVELRDRKLFVKNKKQIAEAKRQGSGLPTAASPKEIVIIGGGRGRLRRGRETAARAIRWKHRHAQQRRAPPVDRPNLSKDYLAGNAPQEWVPRRPDSFYADNAIDLRLNASVIAIDLRSREVTLAEGSKIPYDRVRRRFDFLFLALTSHTCTRGARSPTAARLLSGPRWPAERWYWEQASSVWRLRRRCAPTR